MALALAPSLAKSRSAAKAVNWGSNQTFNTVGDSDEDQQAVDSSLASFAQEETVRRMQTQLDAQSKQMQAQAQLTLQSRQQVTALEVRLQAQKVAGRAQDDKVAAKITRPQRQAASIATAVQ